MVLQSFSSYDKLFTSHADSIAMSVKQNAEETHTYKMELQSLLQTLHSSMAQVSVTNVYVPIHTHVLIFLLVQLQVPADIREVSVREMERLRDHMQDVFQVFQGQNEASLRNSFSKVGAKTVFPRCKQSHS